MKTLAQEFSMKSMISFAILALASIAWSGTASALSYNLRTIPVTPQAGVPFVAAFDSDECMVWMLLPDAEPPVVTVQGNLVRLEVDRIAVANCSNQPLTNTLSVPALPTGTYQLELIGRAYQSPGNDLLVETITFQVAPAVAASTFTISANNKAALVMLIGLMLSLGYALLRTRE
jgi:hypothetical protein